MLTHFPGFRKLTAKQYHCTLSFFPPLPLASLLQVFQPTLLVTSNLEMISLSIFPVLPCFVPRLISILPSSSEPIVPDVMSLPSLTLNSPSCPGPSLATEASHPSLQLSNALNQLWTSLCTDPRYTPHSLFLERSPPAFPQACCCCCEQTVPVS